MSVQAFVREIKSTRLSAGTALVHSQEDVNLTATVHIGLDTSANEDDDVIKWKHFLRYWPFVRGIHRSPVNSPRRGQWRGALMFFFDVRPNKQLSKQSWGWWFETPSRSVWRQCNETQGWYIITSRNGNVSALLNPSPTCRENDILVTGKRVSLCWNFPCRIQNTWGRNVTSKSL